MVSVHPCVQLHTLTPDTCAHVNDSVVHVRVWKIMETRKQWVGTVGRVAQLCCSWLSLGKNSFNFPWKKSQWDNTVGKKKKKKKKTKQNCCPKKAGLDVLHCWVDYGKPKTPSMHRRLGSMTVAAGFPWGKQPEFPIEEVPMGQYSCKNKKQLKYVAQRRSVWMFYTD